MYLGIILAVGSIHLVYGMDEARLVSKLLRNYRKNNVAAAARPVNNHTDTYGNIIQDTLDVKYGMTLLELVDIDDRTDIATMQLWMQLQWEDIMLKWDYNDYGGVESVRLPIDRIWQPDITLYRGKSEIMDDHLMPVVSYDGYVTYMPQIEAQVKCDKATDPDSWFKGVITTCELKYGSWTYNGFELNITSVNAAADDDMEWDEESSSYRVNSKYDYNNIEWDADSSSYHVNNKYELVDFTAKRRVKYYPCCEEPYIDFIFAATFK